MIFFHIFYCNVVKCSKEHCHRLHSTGSTTLGRKNLAISVAIKLFDMLFNFIMSNLVAAISAVAHEDVGSIPTSSSHGDFSWMLKL